MRWFAAPEAQHEESRFRAASSKAAMGDGRRGGTRTAWLIAAIAAFGAMALAAGLFIGIRFGGNEPGPPLMLSPTPGTIATPPVMPSPATIVPPPQAGALTADFAQLEAKLHGVAGMAVSAVGTGHAPIALGHWQSGPAWSTMKVPLIIAALREENPPIVTGAMSSAITESDNAAAEQIWASLGDPITAAQKLDVVLRRTGDPTIVQSQRVRPEFTAFGQTDWSLTNQVRFISTALCDNANEQAFALMGQIESDQSWGIGTLPGTRFKGGWGPSPIGDYLVRQVGVVAVPTGFVAVALAVQPASGKFEDGTADLTEMATWLTAHLGALPSGQCAPG